MKVGDVLTEKVHNFKLFMLEEVLTDHLKYRELRDRIEMIPDDPAMILMILQKVFKDKSKEEMVKIFKIEFQLSEEDFLTAHVNKINRYIDFFIEIHKQCNN